MFLINNQFKFHLPAAVVMRHIVLCCVLVVSCAALDMPSQNDDSPLQNYDSLASLENEPLGGSHQKDASVGYSRNYYSLWISGNHPPEGSSQNVASLGSSQTYASLGLFQNYPNRLSSQNNANLGSSQIQASQGFYENYPSIRLSQDDASLKPSRFGTSPRSSRRNMRIGSMNIVHSLIRNLRKGAQDILNIVHFFFTNIIKEGDEIRKNLTSQMQDLGKQLVEHLQIIPLTLYGIYWCISEKVLFDQETEANIILNGTVNPLSCIGDEIEKVGDQLHVLKLLADEAIAGAAEAIEDVKYCKSQSPNMLMLSVCLGECALQTQIKSVAFLSKSALSIARTNVVITSLPMRIELCAAGGLAKYSSALVRAVLNMADCFSIEFLELLLNKS